jgi:TatD DNase family protein
MNARYADVHCHIQFDQYAHDERELISRMKEEGVLGVVVGVDLPSSQKATALAEIHEHLFASVGLHPNRESEGFELSAYRELAQHPKVVAIGECGLDNFRPEVVNEETKEKQRILLQKHIELAAELNKPLIIHARPSKGTQDAYQDLTAILTEAKTKYPDLHGDIHFFVGGVAEAQALVALGFTLSFTAVITFARDYDDVIRAIPLERMLSETDAPYVAPLSRRGQRNDPLAVVEVASQIAQIRGEDAEIVRQTLLENARRTFKLS